LSIVVVEGVSPDMAAGGFRSEPAAVVRVEIGVLEGGIAGNEVVEAGYLS
jgi:hypothetical protein